MQRKPKILIYSRYFQPAYKAGGPVRSVSNLIHALSGRFEFFVVTGDRDRNENRSFEGVTLNQWHDMEGFKVIYLNISLTSLWKCARIANEIKPNFVYLNSFFDRVFGFPIFFVGRVWLSNGNIICAPRGELAPGALRFKTFRKQSLIFLGNLLSLYSKIKWHATSTQEQSDIANTLKLDLSDIISIPNIFIPQKKLIYSGLEVARSGRLQICFISRIHPKKNIEYAINRVIEADIPADFSIYGPIDDKMYWERCKKIIAKSSAHIRFTYYGAIRKEEVAKAFGEAHLFLFPTYSENFGHVILEALSSGCLVVTSDQVPWLDLQKMGIGYNISLESPEKFVAALRGINLLGVDELKDKKRAAFSYALNLPKQKTIIQQYQNELFN